MITLLNRRRFNQGGPIWSLIRKELFRRRKGPLACAASLVVLIGATIYLHTLMYNITSVTPSTWFAAATAAVPSMTDEEMTIMLRSEVGVHVVATRRAGTPGRGDESLFHSIPLDFQGPSNLDEQVLSAPSFKIDKRFFSADGAGKKKYMIGLS